MIRRIINKISRIRKAIAKTDLSFDIDKELIYQLLPEKPVIIDCGAHLGFDAILFSKVEGSVVYVFEPVLEIYNQLLENTKSFKNIHAFNIALADFNGTAEMYISSGYSDGSSSLLKPKKHLEDHPDVFFNKKELVNCMTLDSWAKENNIVKVDMLWLDMQGAEKNMLQAAPKMLSNARIIHSEVSKHESYEGAVLYKDFKKFMAKVGFVKIAKAIPKSSHGGNVLYVRK